MMQIILSLQTHLTTVTVGSGNVGGNKATVCNGENETSKVKILYSMTKLAIGGGYGGMVAIVYQSEVVELEDLVVVVVHHGNGSTYLEEVQLERQDKVYAGGSEIGSSGDLGAVVEAQECAGADVNATSGQ
jgi:hypothetical protein